MITPPITLHEEDHLTRIHLKLALQDVGFVVSEDGAEIIVSTDPDAAARKACGQYAAIAVPFSPRDSPAGAPS